MAEENSISRNEYKITINKQMNKVSIDMAINDKSPLNGMINAAKYAINQSNKLINLKEDLENYQIRVNSIFSKATQSATKLVDLLSIKPEDYKAGVKAYQNETDKVSESLEDYVIDIYDIIDFLDTKLNEDIVEEVRQQSKQGLAWLKMNTKEVQKVYSDELPETESIKKANEIKDATQDYNDKLEQVQDRCDINAQLVNDMQSEIMDNCYEALTKCELALRLYESNVEKIYRARLDACESELQAIVNECTEYHEQLDATIQEKLLQSENKPLVFKKMTNEFIKNYQSAYEKLRKGTQDAQKVGDEIRKIVVKKDKEQKRKTTSNDTKQDGRTLQDKLQEIDDFKKNTQQNLDTVRVNFKIDQVNFGNRVNALLDALQTQSQR
jgi:hypothetical protein